MRNLKNDILRSVYRLHINKKKHFVFSSIDIVLSLPVCVSLVVNLTQSSANNSLYVAAALRDAVMANQGQPSVYN
jgi:hypothetical protein